MSELKHLSWDDYLFQNRHKAYGAYAIRTGEGMNLLKSLLVGVGFIGTLVLLFSFSVKDFPSNNPGDTGPIITLDPTVVDPIPTKPELPPATTVVPPATTKDEVDSDIVPEPKDDVVDESPFNKQDNIGKVKGDDDGQASTPDNAQTTTNTGSGVGNGEEGSGNNENGTEKADDRIYNPRDVAVLAIYPGCEKVEKTKEKLMKCMSEKMQADLGIQMQDFGDIASRNRIQTAQAKLQFIVDKSGKIVNVKVQNSTHQEFSKEAREALENISKRMIQKGKYLKPAEMNDGSIVNMSYVIPVQFETN